jgi:hypothetical protein
MINIPLKMHAVVFDRATRPDMLKVVLDLSY